VILVDKLLMGGIGWVLRRVSDATHAELHDEASLREELLAAEMELELGEIGEEEYAAIEASVLERMRAMRAREAPEAPPDGARFEIEAIEADVGEEELQPPPPELPPAKPAPRPAAKTRKRRGAAKARRTRVR
jgi:hypothetical protein